MTTPDFSEIFTTPETAFHVSADFPVNPRGDVADLQEVMDKVVAAIGIATADLLAKLLANPNDDRARGTFDSGDWSVVVSRD